MYNAARFLEGGQWVPPDQARAAYGSNEKPTKITIRRTDTRGNVCQYYVTDNVESLARHDWWVKKGGEERREDEKWVGDGVTD